MKITEIKERFISKIHKGNSCWTWKGQIYPSGYGSFWYNRKNVLAHRVSWMIFHGEIPENLCVCHTCDNPSCVNPNHLFLGTNKENTKDMIDKNRMHKQQKLLDLSQESKVIQMYKNNIPQREIANLFNISQRTIGKYIHKYLPKKSMKGEENNLSILTEKQVFEIRKMYVPYKISYKKISRKYGVNVSTIERIIRGKTWKHI